MAAADKNQKAFAVGQRVKVESVKASPWSLHDVGSYEGTVEDVHEDGPYVRTDDGTLIVPFASECEIVS